MLAKLDNHKQYLIATLLPLLLAGLSWFLHGLFSAVNIALLYILVVIVAAVNTSTRPALLCALVSFLAFNFTYTEPRGTLLVMHRQDVLMIIDFLLVAVIVSQLTAHIKEQLEQLQARESLTTIELKFLQKLSSALSKEEVTENLRTSVASVPGLQARLLLCENGEIQWSDKEHLELAKVRQQIAEHLHSSRALTVAELSSDNLLLLFLSDGMISHAVLVIFTSPQAATNIARILAQQATLALTRIRLSADLETERQEKENELLRSSLLSSLSHDFKTPLTAMIGASSTLLELRDKLTEQEQIELVQSIVTESRRLNSFTQKLLDMSQLGRAELALDRTPIAVDEIIHAVLKRIHRIYTHSINTSIEPDLPSIEVHSALIEQALYNVLENACKFTADCGTIRLACQLVKNDMLITVEDSGPGIPDCDKERVFVMFHSANRGDRRAAGSGLGLAICKGMVAAHGGNVTITDSPELGGCRVRICLPITGQQEP